MFSYWQPHCLSVCVCITGAPPPPSFSAPSPGPGEAPSNTASILALLETLQNAPHLEVHKDMIRWILKVSPPASTYPQRAHTGRCCLYV